MSRRRCTALRCFSSQALRAAALLALLGLATAVRAPDLRIIDLQPAGTNSWRIRWSSAPGADYQLQRAKDDRFPAPGTNAWLPVVTVRAVGETSSATDVVGPGVRQRFYRLIQLTNDLPVVISPVDPGSGTGAGGGAGNALLRISTGGTQTVSSVVFLDGGNLLGDGAPGIGDSWELNLPAHLRAGDHG